MISIGERVFWRAVNGIRNGIVMRVCDDGNYLVAMGDGKCVVLGESSVLEREDDEG